MLQIWETGDAGMSEEAAMELMNRPPSEREAHKAQAGRDELAELVARIVGEDEAVEAPGGSCCSADPRPPRRNTVSPHPPFA
jgi:hypothetical protein